MRVLQRDYDDFYKEILYAVEYGYTRGHGAAAMEKRPLSVVEKMKQKLEVVEDELNKRLEAYDEDISLKDKRYGSFIDKHYKMQFIWYKKYNFGDIDEIILKAAQDIKGTNSADGVSYLFANRRKLSFADKMRNLFGLKS